MARRIYLDYCATTPLHPSVREAMRAALDEDFGNPSSMHWAGREAARRVGEARAQVARGIGCRPEEIYFTGGATEADNLALSGILHSFLPDHPHLITSAVEHHAVLFTAQQLEREGFPVTYLPVDARGCVDPEVVRAAIRPDTALISVMLINNETGAIQPIREIGALARQAGIRMHTDAVQGVGLLDVTVDGLQVDSLSLSAHKIYGPKGVGALYLRHGTRFSPLMFGGPQEGHLRPGTENVPGIVGLGAAVELVNQHKPIETPRLAQLRQRLLEGLQERIPGTIVNGAPERTAPHVASVTLPGADAEAMLLQLSALGVAASMGSACTSQAIEPSHVLTAMGLGRAQIEATLRISLGFPTTPDEIDGFLDVIPQVYRRAMLD
jgi:cysteine desulfurase